MEDKTEVLKLLALAYRIANEFDHVPYAWDDEDEEDVERVKKVHEMFHEDSEMIDTVLETYNGWNPYDITQELLSTIEGM